MKRSTMIAIWVGTGVLAALIAARVGGYSIPLPFGPARTLKGYMQDVAAKGTLGSVAESLAGRYAGHLSPGVDKDRFRRDVEACLHRRVAVWLGGTDPRLTQKVTMASVDTLASEFTTACLKDLAGEIK